MIVKMNICNGIFCFVWLFFHFVSVICSMIPDVHTDKTSAQLTCAVQNKHLLQKSSLKTPRELSILCDLPLYEDAWIDRMVFSLGCNQTSGECYYIEVTRKPLNTALDFLCEARNNLYYATGANQRPYYLATSGCGPKITAWPRLANLTTDVDKLKTLMKHGHLRENTPYWVQDFALRWTKPTCRAMRRIGHSLFEVVEKPCNASAATICQQGNNFQKTIKYFRNNIGDKTEGLTTASQCPMSGDDVPMATLFVDMVTIDDVLGDRTTPTDNSSNSTTKGQSNRMLIVYLSFGVVGGVALVGLVLLIACRCFRTKIEITYAEPQDAITNNIKYIYEQPYDKRRSSKKIIKVKAKNVKNESNISTYDSSDVKIGETDKTGAASHYDCPDIGIIYPRPTTSTYDFTCTDVKFVETDKAAAASHYDCPDIGTIDPQPTSSTYDYPDITLGMFTEKGPSVNLSSNNCDYPGTENEYASLTHDSNKKPLHLGYRADILNVQATIGGNNIVHKSDNQDKLCDNPIDNTNSNMSQKPDSNQEHIYV